MRSLPSCTVRPSVGVICCLECDFFFLSFSFAPRSSWFLSVNCAELYRVIWQLFIICCRVCFEGDDGLWDPFFKSFVSETACCCSCLTVYGVASTEELVDCPLRLRGGVGVCRTILSLQRTLLGLNSRIPAAVKLL